MVSILVMERRVGWVENVVRTETRELLGDGAPKGSRQRDALHLDEGLKSRSTRIDISF